MKSSRITAVAIALLGAALATAGCGFGAGEQVGEVELTVTRDFGAEPVTGVVVDDAAESDTVMRVLDRNAEIATRYGGGFVQSIDGVSGAVENGRRYDWFFYVNGIESSVGAADYPLRGGEAIWWDYRDWSAAARVPAVVGSWPHPFVDGYDGEEHPVAVECLGGETACTVVRERLEEVGVSPAAGSPDDAIQVLVGPWDRVRGAPAAAQIEAGPQVSGVFGEFIQRGPRFGLLGLDESGEAAQTFGIGTGLVAATRRYDGPPVWVVTGTDGAGVRAAAELLDTAELRDHYAVAVEGEETTPLPVR
ncbi:MAG TPA: DUF4430 domain-containing protein [Solirubrobacterales bacterium]